MSYPIENEQTYKEYIQKFLEDDEFDDVIMLDKDQNFKYMYIKVRGKVKNKEVYANKKPEYDRWEQYVKEINAKAPKGLNNMMQTSRTFCYMM